MAQLFFRLLRFINRLTILLLACVLAELAWKIPYGWAAALVLLAGLASRKGYQLTAYGKSRWASRADVQHLLSGVGLAVGIIAGQPGYLEGIRALFNLRCSARNAVLAFLLSCRGRLQRKPQDIVRLSDAVHIAVFAPTGAGKGTSCIVPFLLNCPESCVVIDIKDGENYRLTADARRRFGHRIVRLDPFGVCGSGGDMFNPIGDIQPDSPLANDEISAIAEAIVLRTGEEKDPHWPDMAEEWIGGQTAAVVAFADGEDKNLQSVRMLLTSEEKMKKSIEMMCASDQWDGMLARRGNKLSNSKDKELASTLTTTNRFMRFLDNTNVAENTRRSSFNPADLLKGKMTIYLVLPPKYIRTQSALLRLWIGSLMREVMKGGLQERNKVHFIIDEAKCLQRMDQLSDILTIGRGYGIRMQLYYQDLGALKSCWPDGADQTLLANTSTVFFQVRDYATAEAVSNRLGKHTIVVSGGGTTEGETYSASQQGGNRSYNSNTSSNWSQVARELLRPEEIIQLSDRTCITFHPGVPPIATTLVRYYEKAFKRPHRKGLFMAAVETLCLFVTVTAITAFITMAVFPDLRLSDILGGLGVPFSE